KQERLLLTFDSFERTPSLDTRTKRIDRSSCTVLSIRSLTQIVPVAPAGPSGQNPTRVPRLFEEEEELRLTVCPIQVRNFRLLGSSRVKESRGEESELMAEAASATAPEAAAGKMTMVVGVDDSDHSFYALQWALQHFFQPGQPQQYRLAVVTAKPTAASAVGLAGPGAADVLPIVEADLKRSAVRVIEKAKELCAQVSDAVYEVVEGDARNVLCEAVERHHAEMLVVGSHGYGAIKRAVLGSVSDYCAHHAHCTVMIVKKPKHKH
ncbi:hypothetical protein EJB05_01201, partial [Eragrostis curvula]